MSLWTRLQTLHARLTADSEAASNADGFLSYRAETHAALTVGLPIGMLTVLTGRVELLAIWLGWLLRGGKTDLPLRVPYRRQLLKETGYALGGTAIGAVLGVGLRSILTALGIPLPPVSLPV